MATATHPSLECYQLEQKRLVSKKHGIVHSMFGQRHIWYDKHGKLRSMFNAELDFYLGGFVKKRRLYY